MPFFDEADAVFAKRSRVESAQDKNANLGVSYLLQRMETYAGILVLATNFKDNIDSAFMRRLHCSLEFTLPDESLRLKLWQTHWPKHVTYAAEIVFADLARLFELTGASIRNIVAHAVVLALSYRGSADSDLMVRREELAEAIIGEYEKLGRVNWAQHYVTLWLDLNDPLSSELSK